MIENEKFNVCIIDNYDSFTYNLVDLLYKIDVSPIVIPNDINVGVGVGLCAYPVRLSHLIISPGPGNPSNSGISIPLIKKYYKITFIALKLLTTYYQLSKYVEPWMF